MLGWQLQRIIEDSHDEETDGQRVSVNLTTKSRRVWDCRRTGREGLEYKIIWLHCGKIEKKGIQWLMKYQNICIVQWKYGSFVRYSSFLCKRYRGRKLFFFYEDGEEEIFMSSLYEIFVLWLNSTLPETCVCIIFLGFLVCLYPTIKFGTVYMFSRSHTSPPPSNFIFKFFVYYNGETER